MKLNKIDKEHIFYTIKKEILNEEISITYLAKHVNFFL